LLCANLTTRKNKAVSQKQYMLPNHAGSVTLQQLNAENVTTAARAGAGNNAVRTQKQQAANIDAAQLTDVDMFEATEQPPKKAKSS
jgi:hypothetical protein